MRLNGLKRFDYPFRRGDSITELSNEIGLYDVMSLWTIKLVHAYFTSGIIQLISISILVFSLIVLFLSVFCDC